MLIRAALPCSASYSSLCPKREQSATPGARFGLVVDNATTPLASVGKVPRGSSLQLADTAFAADERIAAVYLQLDRLTVGTEQIAGHGAELRPAASLVLPRQSRCPV